MVIFVLPRLRRISLLGLHPLIKDGSAGAALSDISSLRRSRGTIRTHSALKATQQATKTSPLTKVPVRSFHQPTVPGPMVVPIIPIVLTIAIPTGRARGDKNCAGTVQK